MNTTIEKLSNHIGKTFELKGWVANKRTGKGLVFVSLRDGSGYCQCVFDEINLDGSILRQLKG